MTVVQKHFDEARSFAISAMSTVLTQHPQEITAAVLVDDIFGRVSIKLWISGNVNKDRLRTTIKSVLSDACGQFWTGQIDFSNASQPEQDIDPLMQLAWVEGSPHGSEERLRINDRVRHHSAWFAPQAQTGPIWSSAHGPQVVVFHGFKGGAGRTTLLASYALARARRGHHVVVVDMDLDAPGIGTLLAADAEGTMANWGTVDYLLESPNVHPLPDYFHVCGQSDITGEGRIEVFPTGQLNDDYLPKLARIDMEGTAKIAKQPFGRLLKAIHAERQPHVILVDGRAGLASSAGLLLSGIAHLHVLISTGSRQSIQGLERVIRHLGKAHVEQGRTQGECVVVQALVPESVDAAEVAQAEFQLHLDEIFRNGYYASEPSDDDTDWSLSDWENQIAPHVAVPISYRARLAHFNLLSQVADLITGDAEFLRLHERLDQRLGLTSEISEETTNG